MKKHIARILIAGSILLACLAVMPGCGNTDQQITNAVQTATTEAITHVTPEFQTPLANYLEAAAKGIYSIDGTPTVQELVAKVLAFIPKDFLDKNPYISTTISTAVSLAYQVYGKPGLTAIGKGIEAGAAPYITKTL